MGSWFEVVDIYSIVTGIYRYSSLTEGKWINDGLLREQYVSGTCEYDSDIVKYKK